MAAAAVSVFVVCLILACVAVPSHADQSGLATTVVCEPRSAPGTPQALLTPTVVCLLTLSLVRDADNTSSAIVALHAGDVIRSREGLPVIAAVRSIEVLASFAPTRWEVTISGVVPYLNAVESAVSFNAVESFAVDWCASISESGCCQHKDQYVLSTLTFNTSVAYKCGSVSTVSFGPQTLNVGVTMNSSLGQLVVQAFQVLPSVSVDMQERSVCTPQLLASATLQEVAAFLTPPFTLPREQFGEASHRIGVSQAHFVADFNCSQPRGFLTSLFDVTTDSFRTDNIYDQFHFYRHTSQLSTILRQEVDGERNTSSIPLLEYSGASTNGSSMTLRYFVRRPPLDVQLNTSWVLTSLYGLPVTLLVVPVSLLDVTVVGSVALVQVVLSYRVPHNVSLQLVGGLCDTSSNTTVSEAEQMDSGGLATVTVSKYPKNVELHGAFRVEATVEESRASVPVLFAWSLDTARSTGRYMCPFHVLSNDAIVLRAVLHFNPTAAPPPQAMPVLLVLETLSQLQSTHYTVAIAVPFEQLSRCLLNNWENCSLLTAEHCSAAYGARRTSPSNATRVCSLDIAQDESRFDVLICAAPAVVSSVAQDVFMVIGEASLLASAPSASLPWLTAAWVAAANTSAICGAFGVWNTSAWWCDCLIGWSTDPTQDPWAPASYRWCTVRTEFLTASPGAASAVSTVASFAEAWWGKIVSGDTTAIVTTVAGLLGGGCALVWILSRLRAACCSPRRRHRHQRSRRRHHRGSPRQQLAIEVPRVLQLEWRPLGRVSHRRSAVVNREPVEEIERSSSSAFSSTTTNTTSLSSSHTVVFSSLARRAANRSSRSSHTSYG